MYEPSIIWSVQIEGGDCHRKYFYMESERLAESLSSIPLRFNRDFSFLSHLFWSLGCAISRAGILLYPLYFPKPYHLHIGLTSTWQHLRFFCQEVLFGL